MPLQFNPYPLEPYLNKIKSEQDNAAMVPNAIAGGITNAFNSFMQARQQGAERERQKKLDELMNRKNQREEDESFIRWGTRDNPQSGLEYQKLFKEKQDSNPWAPISGVMSKNNRPILYNKSTNQVMEAPIDATMPSIQNAASKEQRISEKENSLLQGQLQKADLIIGKVDQALPMVSNMSSGFGSVLSNIPMTSAKNLEATIQTIKANLGFQQLQEMRASSPTGGALGQVSDREIGLLTSAVASLDQAQTPQQLRERLQEIKDSYLRWKENALKVNSSPMPNQSIPQQNRQSATNPQTGEKLYSDDGGQTWHR